MRESWIYERKLIKPNRRLTHLARVAGRTIGASLRWRKTWFGFGPPRPTVHAVRAISFELHTGETLGIVGESGCGKSTLARLLCGWTSPVPGN
ncbi:MAG: ATP-binding cassette domain-containing protein [Thiolinea sp.]